MLLHFVIVSRTFFTLTVYHSITKWCCYQGLNAKGIEVEGIGFLTGVWLRSVGEGKGLNNER